jgi:hypothetical protein
MIETSPLSRINLTKMTLVRLTGLSAQGFFSYSGRLEMRAVVHKGAILTSAARVSEKAAAVSAFLSARESYCSKLAEG